MISKLLIRKKFLVVLGISFVSLLIAAILQYSDAIEFLEMKTLDIRARHSKDITKNDDIIILLIDEASLKTMQPLVGRWPWPRALFADVIDFLSNAGAKLIAFDILFPETQNKRNEQNKLGPDDTVFAASSASSGKVFHAFQLVADVEDEVNKDILNKPVPSEFSKKFSLHNIENKELLPPQKANNFYIPFTELYEYAAGVGVVEFAPDPGGVFRRTHLIRPYQNKYYPVLSMSIINSIFNPKKIILKKKQMFLDDRIIPLQEDGSYLVNMKKEYATLSIGGVIATIDKIMKGETDNLFVSPEEFKDKIVIIGASAVGVEDLKTTSIGDRVPGVLLHASIISNILNNDYIKNTNWSYIFIITFILSFIISTIVITIHSTFTIGMIGIPLLLVSAYIYTAYLLYDFYRYWLLIVSPFMAMALSFIGSNIFVAFTEGRERKRTRKMFEQYVSPNVLTELMDKSKNALASAEVGTREELTILFSDIRGFTNLSEEIPAEQVVEMLNYYFHFMVELVFKNKGTLDKFIGDAIMAFWGAPIKTREHAKDAVLTALEMRHALKEINKHFQQRSYPLFKIGIGINTGEVILGNIGSEKRLDYTIIGDNVNLCSRMEGLTKAYGCDILISENTYRQLQETFPCRTVDLVRVKGKKLPIKILHPILNPKEHEQKELEKAHQLAYKTNKAFELYKQQKWDEAEILYKEMFEQSNGMDHLAEVFIKRCQEYRSCCPGDDWDGCHTMKTK